MPFSTIATELKTIAYNHTASSFSLPAGEAYDIFSILGSGFSTILFEGDGDGVFIIEVIVDNRVEDILPTNQPSISIHSFNRGLVIRVRNPLGISTAQTSSSFSLRGLERR